jgi:hypothetical protein
MEIRLITVREDFEKAYNILSQSDYPLSFYEYTLKHDHFSDGVHLKLIGLFDQGECIGSISYKITHCEHLGRILEIKEIHKKSIKAHKKLLEFLDDIAVEEACSTIKINKNKAERLSNNIFDRFENFLKNLVH